jgi:hypothetical protein
MEQMLELAQSIDEEVEVMSIKPIDLQVMLPRTTHIAKIHNDEQNRSQMLAQQQSSTVQHKAEESVRLVHSQDKANEAERREKEEREKKEKRQEKEKKKNKGNYNLNRKNEEIKISTIDIKI